MRYLDPARHYPASRLWSVGAADAPITSNPIPEPIVKRGLAVRSKTSCACSIRANFIRRSGR